MQAKTTIHGEYLAAIDGLRAIAVLSVLLFHLDIPQFRGGYTGVDVFFVISGFLITRNILSDVDGQRFSFSQFYLRRVARLFPALFTTIALTLAASFWVLGPDDLAHLGQAAILTAVSVSNIFFWLDSGYFDTAAAFKPLLHTWSLAVEEQFYLVWPVMIWLSVTKASKRAAFALILLLGTISLAASMDLVSSHPGAVFFLTPFRVHQFAIGALLAFVGVGPRNLVTSATCGGALVFLIIIACTATDGEQSYLYTALAPALAAGAVIWSSHSALAMRLLASRPAEWVGKRSYSIYLVHWPIVVLWKMGTDFTLSPVEKAIGLIVAVVAGAVLHDVVERPFRFHRAQTPQFRGSVLAGVVGLSVVIFLSGSHFWALRGFPERVPEELTKLAGNLQPEWAARQKAVRTGVCNFQIDTFKAEQFDAKACSSPPKTGMSYLIIGDSFASDAYLVMSKAYPEVYFGQVTVPGCHLRMPKRFDDDSDCRKLFDRAINELAKDYDGVVLASNWLDGHYYRIEDFISHFENTGLNVVIVGQHIRFADRLPAIVMSSLSRIGAAKKAQGAVLQTQYEVNRKIDELFGKSATFIDFMELQCPSECTVFRDDGRLFYLDDSHISLAGAEILAGRMRARYPEIGADCHRNASIVRPRVNIAQTRC
ncbi:acyltransferase family protein [Allomesorhizobium camelthorni]|uniref:Acyltransferase n=1 Tax=Allomesorhizobium camelthorni TaxID=475069 RepID=A0A6G4WDB6_9HYPH|nr:acyltransferase family protein [Mesorhizobium camelthorni]NGO52226.1 acyltransferase [Mesorhizobium camelthorni]